MRPTVFSMYIHMYIHAVTEFGILYVPRHVGDPYLRYVCTPYSVYLHTYSITVSCIIVDAAKSHNPIIKYKLHFPRSTYAHTYDLISFPAGLALLHIFTHLVDPFPCATYMYSARSYITIIHIVQLSRPHRHNRRVKYKVMVATDHGPVTAETIPCPEP